MAKLTSFKQKIRGRPPTGFDPLVGVRIPKETIAALDAWAKSEKISRSEAIRRLVELGLKGKR
jgi:hypothetical protein